MMRLSHWLRSLFSGQELKEALERESLYRSKYLDEMRVAIAAQEATSILREQIKQMREDHASQIAKLEAQIVDYRREELRTSNDVLLAFGIRKPVEKATEMERIQGLAPARTQADRFDDDLNNISPSEWQEIAQKMEDDAFTAEQNKELEVFLEERRKVRGATAPAPPAQSKEAAPAAEVSA